MGLAASQARYLALTARKSDLEYQSQTINSRRIQLSYKTAEIAREYSDGMNNSRIKVQKSVIGENGKTQNTWEELTFQNLLSSGYMLIGSEGSTLTPNPYLENGQSVESYASADRSSFNDTATTDEPYAKTLSAAQYDELGDSGIKDFYTPSEKDKDGNAKTYTLIHAFSSNDKELWEKISGHLETWKNGSNATLKAFAEKFSTGSKTHYAYAVNPDYAKNNGIDIQSLLVSGKAQIATKEFYEYLVSKGLYSPTIGLMGENTFYELMQEFENDQKFNYAGRKSIIDWRSDETDTFESRTYTEDDEAVLAKYEADTAKIQALDKQLEMEEKNIETQHKAVETELENLKKVIQKNIEDTFKIFS